MVRLHSAQLYVGGTNFGISILVNVRTSHLQMMIDGVLIFSIYIQSFHFLHCSICLEIFYRSATVMDTDKLNDRKYIFLKRCLSIYTLTKRQFKVAKFIFALLRIFLLVKYHNSLQKSIELYVEAFEFK